MLNAGCKSYTLLTKGKTNYIDFLVVQIMMKRTITVKRKAVQYVITKN